LFPDPFLIFALKQDTNGRTGLADFKENVSAHGTVASAYNASVADNNIILIGTTLYALDRHFIGIIEYDEPTSVQHAYDQNICDR